MPETPKQMFNSAEDSRSMAQTTKSNSLAVTSLVLSIVAVAVCLGGAFLTDSLEHLKAPPMQYPPGDATQVSDKLGNTFTFFGQTLTLIVANIISITLGATSLLIGLIALGKPRNMPAAIGVILSVLVVLYSISSVFG